MRLQGLLSLIRDLEERLDTWDVSPAYIYALEPGYDEDFMDELEVSFCFAPHIPEYAMGPIDKSVFESLVKMVRDRIERERSTSDREL